MSNGDVLDSNSMLEIPVVPKEERRKSNIWLERDGGEYK